MAVKAVAGSPAPNVDLRSGERRQLRLDVAGAAGEGSTILRNVSRTGVMLEATPPLAIGQRVDIALPELGTRTLTVLWNNGTLYGCRFDAPIKEAAISAALLRAEPLSPTEALQVPPRQHPLPETEKYSLRTRAAIILGSAVAGWGILIAAALAIV
ncbi:MAG: PilZ domain-containing protein [Porphyrobacter sp.]|nr:PilZ domain-containing protein [Porphyrobacter sp.]